MIRIVDFVKFQECPLVDGMIFPDETIQLLDITVNWAVPMSYKITIGAKTSVSILGEKGTLHWCNCTISVNLMDKENSVEVVAGEGNYGSDGFVCVTDLHSKKLLWLAYFTCSNPFKQLHISEKELFAKTTLDCVWRFKLDNPVDCWVQCQSNRFGM